MRLTTTPASPPLRGGVQPRAVVAASAAVMTTREPLTCSDRQQKALSCPSAAALNLFQATVAMTRVVVVLAVVQTLVATEWFDLPRLSLSGSAVAGAL